MKTADLFCPECTTEIRQGYLRCLICDQPLHPECQQRHEERGECVPKVMPAVLPWGNRTFKQPSGMFENYRTAEEIEHDRRYELHRDDHVLDYDPDCEFCKDEKEGE